MAISSKSVLLLIALLLVVTPIVKAELVDEAEEDVKTPVKQQQPSSLQGGEDEKAKDPPISGSKQSAPKASPDSRPNAKTRQKTSRVGVVKFWSKSLSGFRDRGSVMLEEDVVVTQDDIRLEADKATIFFEQGGKDVKEVHAVGSVKFSRTDPETGDPIRAEGREAVFSNAKRTVVMKGEPVLHRGDDVVRGKVIYYDLKNGWVKADRVEGVVQPAAKKAGSK